MDAADDLTDPVVAAPQPEDKMPPVPKREWTDGDLLNLSRSTNWFISHDYEGHELGDYFDARRHIPILYSLAVNVNWGESRLVRPKAPPYVLEVGVRHGVTTMALLHAMREANGVLTSVEIDQYCDEATLRRIEAAGLLDWWDLKVMDCREYAKQARPYFDMVWIDGDHSEEIARHDIETFGALVRRNGIMAMHDAFGWPDPDLEYGNLPPTTGVTPVVEGLDRRKWEVVTLPWSFGLSICRRI